MKVYEYSLRWPTHNATLVDDQIRLAHRYRNTLTEIERTRRTESGSILSTHDDVESLLAQVATLAAERDAARDRIRLGRAATRSKSESAADREIVRELGARLKELRAQAKEAKRIIAQDPEIRRALDLATEHAQQRRRDERKTSGVYWGTYLLIEEAADQAAKSKTCPRFVRFAGDGRVGVQVQGGIDVGELATDTRVQIATVEHVVDHSRPGRPASPTGASRRAGQRHVLRIRVGSDGRAPVWAEWPMIMHRPIPVGARIKSVVVQRRRRDRRRWDWRVRFVVDDAVCPPRRATPADGACALNLGWALVEGGIRAGYLVGDDGAEREILVPSSIARRLDKAEAIRSRRDQDLNAMRSALVERLRALDADLPEWIVDACVLTRPSRSDPMAPRTRIWHVQQWRSPDRFAALVRRWRDRRWSGDAESYAALEAWRYRDEHLQRYEAGLVRGALGHRREIYRRVAAELAARYRTLVVDDTDLREFQRSPRPEEERTEYAPVKVQQRRAAPSLLRQALDNAFGAARIVEISAVDLTRRCHACGSIERRDRATSGRFHTCSGCGERWDQDANACRNLLRERPRAETEREAARAAQAAGAPKETRSQRLRRGRKRIVVDEALASG